MYCNRTFRHIFINRRVCPACNATGDAHPVAQDQPVLLEVLQEQLRQANEREREGREREVRLLAMLESEQQARRELETKLLPAPRPAPVGKVRAWILLVVLVALLAFVGWQWRNVIVSWLLP